MASARLLLVDDDESVRSGLQGLLEAHDFQVVVASNVNQALKLIASEPFDVLLSDLHMPGAGDGLTVVSAMRHANPNAVTIVLSANPDMAKAAAALVKQADDLLRKPIKIAALVETIRERLTGVPRAPSPALDVATLLDHEAKTIRKTWLDQMDAGGTLSTVSVPLEERCEHLPESLRDIIFRLRYPQAMGSTTLFSMSALQHGARRRRQGIGAATLVEESRALQVALFQVISDNLGRINASHLPDSLMAIADEINAQLFQTLSGYENEQPVEAPGDSTSAPSRGGTLNF